MKSIKLLISLFKLIGKFLEYHIFSTVSKYLLYTYSSSWIKWDTIGENSFLFSQTYSNFPCVENTKTAKTSTFCNMYFHFQCIFFIKVQGKLADAAFVQKKNMYLDQTFWVTLMSEPLKNVKYSILFVSDLG